MKRIVLCLVLILLLSSSFLIAAETREYPCHPDDYWVEDFEKEGVVFAPAYDGSAQYRIVSCKVVEEGIGAGKRCGKVEVLFSTPGGFYLRIPFEHRIVMDEGYVACDFCIRGTGYYRAARVFIDGKDCEYEEDLSNGWIHVLSGKLKGSVGSVEIYFNVSAGSTLAIYVDNIRISRTETLVPPDKNGFASLYASWEGMLKEIPTLKQQLKDESLSLALEKAAGKVAAVAERARQSEPTDADRGKFASAMDELEKVYGEVKWRLLTEKLECYPEVQ